MSTSICSEKSGIVAFDSAILRAIVCWVRVSSTIVVSPLAVVTPDTGVGANAAAASSCSLADAPPTPSGAFPPTLPTLALAAPAAAACSSTSAFTIRPTRAAARHSMQVDAAVLRDPLRKRRGLDVLALVGFVTVRNRLGYRRRRRLSKGNCACAAVL